MTAAARDLVVLAADKDIEATLQGLLSRPQRLRIRDVSFKVEVDPEHDPGCFRRAHDILCPQARLFSRALVIFDHQGSGQEARIAEQVSFERCVDPAFRPLREILQQWFPLNV